MKREYFGNRSIRIGVSAAVLLLLSGGCLPADQQQWAEFLLSLLRNSVAALLL